MKRAPVALPELRAGSACPRGPDTTGCDRPRPSGFAAPASGPSGSPRESSRALPHDPADRSDPCHDGPKGCGSLSGNAVADARRENRASQRRRRADGRPEPRMAPPAPVFRSRARPWDLRPSSWRMAATWVACRSGSKGAIRPRSRDAQSRRHRAFRPRRGPQDRRADGGTGAIGSPASFHGRSRASRHRAAIW